MSGRTRIRRIEATTRGNRHLHLQHRTTVSNRRSCYSYASTLRPFVLAMTAMAATFMLVQQQQQQQQSMYLNVQHFLQLDTDHLMYTSVRRGDGAVDHDGPNRIRRTRSTKNKVNNAKTAGNEYRGGEIDEEEEDDANSEEDDQTEDTTSRADKESTKRKDQALLITAKDRKKIRNGGDGVSVAAASGDERAAKAVVSLRQPHIPTHAKALLHPVEAKRPLNARQAYLQQRRARKYPPPYIDYGDANATRPLVDSPLNATHPDCLVVYHIPKTGGLTLGAYLKVFAQAMGWTFHEWYSYFGRYQDAPIDSTPFGYRNRSVIHIGHLTSRFEQETQTQHCAKMTLLREPVDRVISAFYYHGHPDSDWGACLNSTCRLWWEYTNDFTRRFTAHGGTWNSYVTQKYLANDPLTHQSLSQAQATLERFQFICFIDNIRDCILRMGRHYGVELDLPVELVHNANAKRKEVSITLKERIAKHNWMDAKLYEWANLKFGDSP